MTYLYPRPLSRSLLHRPQQGDLRPLAPPPSVPSRSFAASSARRTPKPGPGPRRHPLATLSTTSVPCPSSISAATGRPLGARYPRRRSSWSISRAHSGLQEAALQVLHGRDLDSGVHESTGFQRIQISCSCISLLTPKVCFVLL